MSAFDPPKLYNYTPEVTPVAEMTCEQILKTDIAQIGYTKSFDGENGRIVLLGGRDCWKEITQAISDADSFIRTKLQKLEQKDYDMHGLSLPTYDEYVKMVDEIPNYSDGVLLLTAWKWKAADVQPGQGVGLCLQQGAGTYASCWGFNKKADGTFETKNDSYSLDLDAMPASARLADYENIGGYQTPAFNGSWLCSPVHEMGECNHVACLRFVPKEEKASLTDPRYSTGEVKVVSYLEGRTADTADTPSVKDKVQDKVDKVQEKYDEGMSRFEEFRLNLTMGAFQNMFVSTAALTAALLSTTF